MPKTTKYAVLILGSITLINLLPLGLVKLITRIYALSTAAETLLMTIAALVSATIVTLLLISATPVVNQIMIGFRRLIRYENLSHPLLMKLSVEAPSTYHHSLNVATLSHRAAKAIRADSILARIGAYYHDIGKLTNPAYFAENLLTDRDDIHQAIDQPQHSFELILSHVTEGIRLANNYNLPEEIIALIAQHHGTTVALSFFNRAQVQNPKIKKDQFRYPGPKPLSKEAGILMLADAVESKIRTLTKHDEPSITQTIDELIEARLNDHQLELSGLTSLDLKRIRKSFIETALVMYHDRPSYEKTPA